MASEWEVELDHNSGESSPSDIEHLLNNTNTSHELDKYDEDQIEHGLLIRTSVAGEDGGILVDSALSVLGQRNTDSKHTETLHTSLSDHEEEGDVPETHHSPVTPPSMGDPSQDRRKSARERRQKRSYSPVLQSSLNKKKPKRMRRNPAQGSMTMRPYDKLDNGKPFSCDLCKSPYVCNPSRRGNKLKHSKHQPSPRQKIDPVSKKLLTLCNACGLMFDRPKKIKLVKQVPSLEDKEKYLEEARTFAQSLAEGLNDPDAERLACPQFKFKPCGCLQRYIMGDGTLMEASRERATQLLCLLKKAKSLRQQKAYNLDELMAAGGRSKKGKNIGVGNGQKRSQVFEDFVKRNRHHLREDLMLCERACQRVLMYSNNFLHKKLKTEERSCRAERVKGQAALGLLPLIHEIGKQKCCVDNCAMLAVTHANLLQSWRERARSGQAEARRVLAEMLTPSGGARANCYKFIQSVTGCSFSTICNVSNQMKRTGGDREPPEHGLKKYWQQHPKQKEKNTNQKEGGSSSNHPPSSKPSDISKPSNSSATISSVGLAARTTNATSNQVQLFLQQLAGGDSAEVTTSGSTGNSQLTSLQIQAHRQQILLLQRQLAQQQLQLQQQQQLLQQQLLQQVLIENVAEGVQPNSVQVQTLQSLLQLVTQQLQQAQGVVMPSEIQVTPASQNGENTTPQVVTLTTAADWQPYLQQVTLQDANHPQQVPPLQLTHAPSKLNNSKQEEALGETAVDQQQEGSQPGQSGNQSIIHLQPEVALQGQEEGRSLQSSAGLTPPTNIHQIEVVNENCPVNFQSELAQVAEPSGTTSKEFIVPVHICNVFSSETYSTNPSDKNSQSPHGTSTRSTEVLVEASSTKTHDSTANNGGSSAAQNVVQQILELSQINNGTARGGDGGGPQLGINLTQAQTTQLLAQLAECGNTVAPNVNIALLHQQNSQSQVSLSDQQESQSDPSSNCTILTIEPQITALAHSDEGQGSYGQLQVCNPPATSSTSLIAPQLQMLSQNQGEPSSAQLEIVEADGNHYVRVVTVNDKGESADVVLPLVDQSDSMDR